MSIRATGGFSVLRYEPGNPQFPTLPDGIAVPHVTLFGAGAGRAYRAPLRTKNVFASAPAGDEQRFAGWQTQTTWINPSVVDFGVIPSPVQRTVSLYNARSTPIIVTALTLPAGVTLVSPALPVTLYPYAGDVFTLEAGITGSALFDEFHIFTTSQGTVSFRLLGRRATSLNNIPETPMRETMQFRTDLLRSTDGSEKAYSLMSAPLTTVDYQVKFTNDIQRIRFKNQFIGGESALVVAGQKWYEARDLILAASPSDTSLLIDYPIDASWTVDLPLSVVTNDGSVASAQIQAITFGPDPDFLSNTLLVRFDGANGSQAAVDLSPLARTFTWIGGQTIDTSQSVFGGSSLLCAPTAGTAETVIADYDPAMEFTNQDFTVQFWMRPTAADKSTTANVLARWFGSSTVRSWRIQVGPTALTWTINSGGTTNFSFPYGSPHEVQADTWHYIEFNRSAGNLRCFVDGVEIGTGLSMLQTLESGAVGLRFSGYQEGGVFQKFAGHVDDVRITVGLARNLANYTPPTVRHPAADDSHVQLDLSSAIGISAPLGSKVMPIGLGYVSRFPQYRTHAKNLEEVDYSLTFNQERDLSALDPSFPTLTDLQSPANTLVVLDFCNEISSQTKGSQIIRAEYSLESGLTNRAAFSRFPFGDHVSEFRITLNSEAEIWKWRTFIHHIRGSYGEFYVPTFTNDLPGVTTAASNVFSCEDTDLALLFGNPPDPRRNAIRLIYPDGTVLYRMITQVIDNVATEEITVSSAVNAGNPEIGYLQRSRMIGDTVSFEHIRTDYSVLTFRFRTVLL